MNKRVQRLRGFLGLTFRDIELATGISAARLCAAERARLELSEAELRILKVFLYEQLKAVVEAEGWLTPDTAVHLQV